MLDDSAQNPELLDCLYQYSGTKSKSNYDFRDIQTFSNIFEKLNNGLLGKAVRFNSLSFRGSTNEGIVVEYYLEQGNLTVYFEKGEHFECKIDDLQSLEFGEIELAEINIDDVVVRTSIVRGRLRTLGVFDGRFRQVKNEEDCTEYQLDLLNQWKAYQRGKVLKKTAIFNS